MYMPRFILELISLRVLFKFIFFVIGIFVIYALYMFVENSGDISELKNYIKGAIEGAIKWLSKVLTFYLDKEEIKTDDSSALLDIKNTIDFIKYYITSILC